MGQNPDLHTGTRRAGSTGGYGPVVPDTRTSGSTGWNSGSTAYDGSDSSSSWRFGGSTGLMGPVVPVGLQRLFLILFQATVLSSSIRLAPWSSSCVSVAVVTLLVSTRDRR